MSQDMIFPRWENSKSLYFIEVYIITLLIIASTSELSTGSQAVALNQINQIQKRNNN